MELQNIVFKSILSDNISKDNEEITKYILEQSCQKNLLYIQRNIFKRIGMNREIFAKKWLKQKCEIELLAYVTNEWRNLDYLHLKFQVDDISITVTLSIIKHLSGWNNYQFTFRHLQKSYEFSYNDGELYESDKGSNVDQGMKCPDNENITKFILFFGNHGKEFLTHLLQFETN